VIKSVQRILIALLLVSAIYISFVGGQTLANRYRPLDRPRGASPLLSANANREGALGDPGPAQDNSANVSPEDIFETVLEHVQREYVERTDGTDARLSSGALAQMFASLDDPRTSFLEPTLRQARQDALQGHFHGIGAVLAVTQSQKQDVPYRCLTVIDVMPDSPAERTGLKPGDRITEVDGHWLIAYWLKADTNRLIAGDITRIIKDQDDEATQRQEAEKVGQRFRQGYNLTKAMPLLTTGDAKTLKLTVERAGLTAPLKLEITTGPTEVDPVMYRTLDGQVGYLRVRLFNPKAAQEFESALGKLEGGLKGLIVDLRGNPGGVQAEAKLGVDGYEAARRLIALLTHGGTVATIEHRPNKPEPLVVTPATPHVALPLVVLVDQGTANLSELVAVALRHAGEARIVGMRTFGDPILPLFVVFKSGSGAVIAHARLLTASGVSFGKGIAPDIAVAADGREDAALERAQAVLE
jgi:carboxyl-terminal processing protease